jgi:hypothetical protein
MNHLNLQDNAVKSMTLAQLCEEISAGDSVDEEFSTSNLSWLQSVCA